MTIENQKCLNFFDIFFKKMQDFLKSTIYQIITKYKFFGIRGEGRLWGEKVSGFWEF